MTVNRVINGGCASLITHLVASSDDELNIVVATRESYDEVMDAINKFGTEVYEPIKLYEMDDHQISRISADYGGELVLYKLEEILQFFFPGVGSCIVSMNPIPFNDRG